MNTLVADVLISLSHQAGGRRDTELRAPAVSDKVSAHIVVERDAVIIEGALPNRTADFAGEFG